MSRKRFAVLIAVQILLLVHIAQWLVMGKTFSALEPSESMETVKDGIINVGTLLFGAALLSTAILGRWFCGWGCHVILLQDLCVTWLAKCGIRPKPFRSRLLLWVPLLLALYMFAWPLVYRLALAPFLQPNLHWPGWTWRLTVTDFWQSMPGWMIAIPFLGVCGFLTVYLLGGKAYCTYGCPYGGFFAPLDRFARGRIRVSDACEGCGHCTAVCSSNVRVHEEVRDFGMVVDPGCMKCMDCVAACPKEALSFGMGPAPAASAPPAAARLFDLSLRDELIIAVIGFGTLLAVRGAYGLIPLLFASGIGACVAFIAWKGWDTLRLPNVAFHTHLLRIAGRWRPLGVVWVIGTALILAFVIHTGAVNLMHTLADRLDQRVTVTDQVVFGENGVEVDAEMANAARSALDWYSLVSNINAGGWALGGDVWQQNIDTRRAWLHAVLREFETSRVLLDGQWAIAPSEGIAANLARVHRSLQHRDEADAWYRDSVIANPTWNRLRDEMILGFIAEGRVVEAIAEARRWVEVWPGDLTGMRRLSLILIDSESSVDQEEGVALIRTTLEIEPNNGGAFFALALGEARLGHPQAALPALERAHELLPDDPRIAQALDELRAAVGATQ